MKKIALYALHGFLGQPSDWTALFKNHSLQSSLKALDLFQKPLAPMEQWAEQFNREAAERQLRVLMGYSLGGRLAMHALLQNPGLWDAAVIISAHSGLSSEKEREQRLLADEKWAKRFEHEDWEALLCAWNGRDVFKNTMQFDRRENEYSRERLASSLRVWSLGRQQHLLPQLNQLEMPILWVAGADDITYATQAQSFSLNHSLSKRWVVSDAGHRIPWQKPNQFLEELIAFLGILPQKLL